MMFMENISCSDLEENFDSYLDRVHDGEQFLIDGKVVLCGDDGYDWLNDHSDGC